MDTLLRNKNGKAYLIAKGAFDILASLCASIILMIPMIIITLIIMLNDPGNPFYVQKRMGKNGKEIAVLKFRSMKMGADCLEEMLTPEQRVEYLQEYKLKDDPRLIGYQKPGDGERCFGAILRRTSIDELPQILFNILFMRNMSIVGPRPILKEELEQNYSEEQQKRFLSVKPGLTGYWQAYARNNATYETGERQKMEMFYVENRSLKLDMRIIFRTIVAVLKAEGAE